MSNDSPIFVPASVNWAPARKTRLPVDITVALKPWFDNDTLQTAFDLIISGNISRYLFFRHGAAVVFDDGSSALVMMPKNPRLRQGFTCRDGWCSRCKQSSRKEQRCPHIAAVALLGLGRDTDNGQLPAPLIFPDSSWFTIGRHLSAVIDTEKTEIALQPNGDGYHLIASGKNDLRLTVRLTTGAVSDLVSLFSSSFVFQPDQKREITRPERLIGKTTKAVFASLISRTRTGNERDLHHMGSRSKREQRDTSFWMVLTRLLFLGYPAPEFRADRNSQGLFFLRTTAGKDKPVFHLTLPKTKCVELLDLLTTTGPPTHRMPAAEPFSIVTFTDDHKNLRIEHYVRLEDDRTLSLGELKDSRYGNHYYLDDYGFFSVTTQKNADKLQMREVKPQLSLFAAVEQIMQPQTGFTVATEDIPSFLLRNAKPLRTGVHQVDPDVLKLHMVEIPERLQLESYEERDDWCYLAGFYDLGNQTINLDELLRRGGGHERYIAGKKWLKLTDTSLAWFHELGEDRICLDAAGESAGIRLRRHEMLALAGLLPEITPPVTKGNMRSKLDSLLNTDSWLKPVSGDLLPEHLRDYQRHGVAWLDHLVGFHLGGILADDMGLGKTHQALTLLTLLAKRDQEAQYLIVCPTSVVLHWLGKGENFFPELEIALYYGPKRNLEEALQARVIATTFGIMRNDISLLSQTRFKVILFDEMQNLKNAKTGSHKAALQLNGDSLIGLTGTPIENALTELKALFDICMPGMFDNQGFRRFIRDDSPEMRKQLNHIIKPFILRRTRGRVLEELPPVIEDIRLCELHADQVGLYRQIVGESDPLIRELLDEDEQASYINILATITRLKQVCDHPCLLEGCTDHQQYGSGKWDLWRELIDECMGGGFKVVIFSQFTTMLDIMAAYLRETGREFCEIRGNMTPKKRQESIEKFDTQDACRICLASLLAGGTGIDLTAAQVVIHYDRWWNPAKEEQATARVHRMGQKHTVQVIKLVSAGTLEEKIHGLIEKKRALADDIITEDDASIMKHLSRQDLASLLQWQG